MPYKYTDQISEARANAAPMQLIDGAWRLIPTNQPQIVAINLKTAPDSYPITLNAGGALTPNHYIAVSTLAELADVLDEYLDITSSRDFSASERARQIEHEGRHGEASMYLGAKSVRYALQLHANLEAGVLGWKLAHCPVDLETTKIGAAVLLAYPEVPSRDDHKAISNLGYSGIRQVADLAVKHRLPVPLSNNLRVW